MSLQNVSVTIDSVLSLSKSPQGRGHSLEHADAVEQACYTGTHPSSLLTLIQNEAQQEKQGCEAETQCPNDIM